MADKPIEIIRVGKGTVNRGKVDVGPGWGVVWIPETTGVKVKVKFKNKTPFSKMEIPGRPEKGGPAYAVVRDNAVKTDYEYGQPGSRRKRPGIADPVIIVKDIKRKKAAGRKVARKK